MHDTKLNHMIHALTITIYSLEVQIQQKDVEKTDLISLKDQLGKSKKALESSN